MKHGVPFNFKHHFSYACNIKACSEVFSSRSMNNESQGYLVYFDASNQRNSHDKSLSILKSTGAKPFCLIYIKKEIQ
jgi:hypothetical protein